MSTDSSKSDDKPAEKKCTEVKTQQKQETRKVENSAYVGNSYGSSYCSHCGSTTRGSCLTFNCPGWKIRAARTLYWDKYAIVGTHF